MEAQLEIRVPHDKNKHDPHMNLRRKLFKWIHVQASSPKIPRNEEENGFSNALAPSDTSVIFHNLSSNKGTIHIQQPSAKSPHAYLSKDYDNSIEMVIIHEDYDKARKDINFENLQDQYPKHFLVTNIYPCLTSESLPIPSPTPNLSNPPVSSWSASTDLVVDIDSPLSTAPDAVEEQHLEIEREWISGESCRVHQDESEETMASVMQARQMQTTNSSLMPSSPKPSKSSHISLSVSPAMRVRRRKALSMDSLPQQPYFNAHLILRDYVNVFEFYSFGEEVGKGSSGTVRKCVEKSTGETFACKTVLKSRLRNKLDVDDLLAEVQIMTFLCSHPFVLSFKKVFEDRMSVHLILEFCEGGDLYSRIKSDQKVTETEAAIICQRLSSVLSYCHSNGIMHRDLKLENILLASRDSNINIRLADFGSATFFKPGQQLNQMVGSPLYIAPSVLQHCYGPKADTWSLGVVLYILLSGVAPFAGTSTVEVLRSIQSEKIDMESGVFRYVSMGAKDLLAGLLERNESNRISADEVERHPWVQYHCTFQSTDSRRLYCPSRYASKPQGQASAGTVGKTCLLRRKALLNREKGRRSPRSRRHSLDIDAAVIPLDRSDFGPTLLSDEEGAAETEARKDKRSVLTRVPTPFWRLESGFDADDEGLIFQERRGKKKGATATDYTNGSIQMGRD